MGCNPFNLSLLSVSTFHKFHQISANEILQAIHLRATKSQLLTLF